MKNKLTTLFFVLPFFIFGQGGFTILDYHVDVQLDDKGTARINETIKVKFNEERRGIIRKIPTKGKFNGHRQSIRILDVHVDGWKFFVNPGSEYEIKIGDKDKYILGNQEYKISFRAENGILNYENHEEFYWTLIGGDWDADILNSSYTITLPQNVELTSEDYQVFSGKVGESTSFGTIEKDEQTISGKSLSTLGKGKALTVGLRLPKGYFFGQDKEKITTLAPPKVYTKDKTYPLPILLILSFISSFFVWGRNRKQSTGIARYYPPNEMSSAEVGTYYDYTVHGRDLLSLIPYWGEKGYIKVRVHPKTRTQDIYLEKQMEIPKQAPDHERYFFDHIFAYDNVVYIDELEDDFYNEYVNSKKMLKEDILDKKLYDPQAVKTFHSNLSFLLAAVIGIMGILSIVIFQWIGTGMGLFALALAIFVIKFLRPKRSLEGQKLHEQLEEFKNTVKNPNENELVKIVKEDPRYFDKIFPYAVAFGLDKQWLESFQKIGSKPDWYYYNDYRHFTYGDFSNDFNLKKIQNKMIVPPQASSDSSSFGGGGFSGGGFGGGGGSSW